MTPPLILAVETSSRMGSVAIALGQRVLAESRFSSPLRHSAEVFPAIQGLLDRFERKAAQIEHVYISVGPGSFTGLRIATALAKTMHLANAARIVAVDTLDVIAANVVSLTAAGGATDDGRWVMDDERRTTSDEFELQDVDCDRIAAVLDAKRGQFFIAVYENTDGHGREHGRARTRPCCSVFQSATVSVFWRKVLPDSLMTVPQFLAQFAGRQEPVWLLGDGLVYYRDKFEADGIHFFDQTYWSPRARNVHVLGWYKALRGDFAEPLTLTPNYLRKPDITMKSH